MTERTLIVNADDFGLSGGVNAGIDMAHRDGILTSATLMANGLAFAGAVEIARANPRLGVGIHLNIVGGRPLSPPASVSELATAEGTFRPFRRRRLTRAFLAHAEVEYRAQIEKVLAAGIEPTHVDFEKHHAWQAGLYMLACRLAEEYGIAAVRNLAEPVWWSLRRLGWPGWRRLCMASALRTGVTLSRRRTGLARPARLLGQLHIGALDEERWVRLAASVPEGVSEVMVHPGKCGTEDAGMGPGWLGSAREVELNALLSPRVREALGNNQVRLVSFRDIP